MTFLGWVERLSAVGFWALIGLASYGAWRTHKAAQRTWFDLSLEDDEEPLPWGWIFDPEGPGQPFYVPIDLIQEAIEVLSQETIQEAQKMAADQWRWVLTPMGIRQAMAIAQEEPDIEMAFLTWVAQQTPPNLEDRP